MQKALLDHTVELKRFEEQMRDAKFDPKVGKLYHKVTRESLVKREGTTYDADG